MKKMEKLKEDNYDVDNSIIKICEKENNGLKEKVSYILLKSTTTANNSIKVKPFLFNFFIILFLLIFTI